MGKYTDLVEQINSINELERALEKILKGVDVRITRHFLDRIKDRSIEISSIYDTLEKFTKKYSGKLQTSQIKKVNGVVKDIASALNIPMSYDNKGTKEPDDDILSLITVMKKRGFVPNNPRDIVFNVR